MNAKKLTVSIFVIIFIVFATISTIVYDNSNDVDIICYEGSYAEEYAKKHEDETFAVSGKAISGLVPPELEALKNLKNVVLLGYVTDGEVKALMKKCKAFVFPSYYEGFGIPPLEALSCGTKVVVSNRASLPEIYKDSAFYIDADSTNCNLAKLLEKKVDSPQKILENYTYENAAKKLLKAIKSL